MKWKNVITQILDIEYPIIQAPMFGVSTPAMAAAAAEANCLGSLALGDLCYDDCAQAIRATKKLNDKKFAANIFAHQIPPVTDALKEKYANAKTSIERLAKQNNVEISLPNIEDLILNDYHEQIDAIIDEDCKILSFTFGVPDKQSIGRLKSKGIILMGTCTSANEAIILEKGGIDIICVQGLEAGGHRGSFSENDIPKIGGLSLLAQVSERVKAPIIYAGGIYNAKTLLASQTLGASGFQVGSLLLGSAESALQDFEKERLRRVEEGDIVLTKSFSGRYARGIKNAFINAVEHADFILPYPYQNKLTTALRKLAKANKNADFTSIWLGQSIHDFSERSTTEILKSLIADTDLYQR